MEEGGVAVPLLGAVIKPPSVPHAADGQLHVGCVCSLKPEDRGGCGSTVAWGRSVAAAGW